MATFNVELKKVVDESYDIEIGKNLLPMLVEDLKSGLIKGANMEGDYNMATFNVELKKVVDESYDIEIGKNLLPMLVEDLKSGLIKGANRYAIVTDSNVKELYGDKLLGMMKEVGFDVNLISFPAGEKSKVRSVKEYIEDTMIDLGYKRDSCIIAVGGGVVTDMAGFVAGTFGRGIPFINYATSLLGAADASVGGKTAVDTPVATNLIGLIYQPKKLYIDIDAWNTLPKEHISNGLAETIKHAVLADREFFTFLIGLIYQPKKLYIDIDAWNTLPKEHISNGLAETIKHAVLADREFFTFLEQNVDKLLEDGGVDKYPEICERIAETNCKIKYEVVKKDEREANLRQILNLGHTVGRAIETLSDYKLLHGEAVAIGLVMQARIAEKLGYASKEDVKRVEELTIKAGLPIDIPEYMSTEEVVNKLYTDKKVRKGKIRFVFQKGIGDVMCFEDGNYSTPLEEAVIREFITELR